jgi:hypothetical protein
MNTNKQPREIRSEFTANGMMAIAPARNVASVQQNGWTVGKDFFKPVVAKKQPAKNKSFLSRFL